MFCTDVLKYNFINLKAKYANENYSCKMQMLEERNDFIKAPYSKDKIHNVKIKFKNRSKQIN